jgi:hypothetical protein
MPSSTKRPGAEATAAGSESGLLGGGTVPTNSTLTDRQARRLAERFALPWHTASAVAALAFTTGASSR